MKGASVTPFAQDRSVGKVSALSRRIRTTAAQAWLATRSLRQLPLALRLGSRLRTSPRYLFYLCVQLEKSTRYAGITSERTSGLVAKAVELEPGSASRQSRSVLCVGCRNVHELELFRTAGFGKVVGVDLFASDPRIQPMDMHAMTFADSQFDVVYSCHNFEHSSEPLVAAKEFMRVAKPNGICVIEVPIGFKASLTDLSDYGSAAGLLEVFRPYVGDVMFQEESPTGLDSRVARVGFRVLKTGKVVEHDQ